MLVIFLKLFMKSPPSSNFKILVKQFEIKRVKAVQHMCDILLECVFRGTVQFPNKADLLFPSERLLLIIKLAFC